MTCMIVISLHTPTYAAWTSAGRHCHWTNAHKDSMYLVKRKCMNWHGACWFRNHYMNACEEPVYEHLDTKIEQMSTRVKPVFSQMRMLELIMAYPFSEARLDYSAFNHYMYVCEQTAYTHRASASVCRHGAIACSLCQLAKRKYWNWSWLLPVQWSKAGLFRIQSWHECLWTTCIYPPSFSISMHWVNSYKVL